MNFRFLFWNVRIEVERIVVHKKWSPRVLLDYKCGCGGDLVMEVDDDDTGTITIDCVHHCDKGVFEINMPEFIEKLVNGQIRTDSYPVA